MESSFPDILWKSVFQVFHKFCGVQFSTFSTNTLEFYLFSGYFTFSRKRIFSGKLSTLLWGGEFISTSLEHPGFLDGVSVRKNQLWKCLPPLLGFVGRLTAIELSFCQTIIMHFLAAPITIYNIRIRHRKEWKRIHFAIAIASHCLKITQNVAFEFSTNFCPIKNDLSGNTVGPQASGFQKFAKMDRFWHF